MKLPNPGQAVVDIDKLRDYCLNFEHPCGKHKARVFKSALGLTSASADIVRERLLLAAQNNDAFPAGHDEYGSRYIVDFLASGPTGQAIVRSLWIVRTGENFPRLTSCYVL